MDLCEIKAGLVYKASSIKHSRTVTQRAPVCRKKKKDYSLKLKDPNIFYIF